MADEILDESDFEVVDITPKPKAKRRWRLRIVLAAVMLSLLSLPFLSGVYVDTLWFGSLGFSQVYWYPFYLSVGLFFVFGALTLAILRGGFWLLQRGFASYSITPKKIVLNEQKTVLFDPTPFLKPVFWVVSLVFALGYGFSF
ncbi:MAG: UPF0182 family protein, partial [Acidobacteria bacterium]|nr:UPF0182 family protein [Acidobacteriota bacterium]